MKHPRRRGDGHKTKNKNPTQRCKEKNVLGWSFKAGQQNKPMERCKKGTKGRVVVFGRLRRRRGSTSTDTERRYNLSILHSQSTPRTNWWRFQTSQIGFEGH